MIIELRRSKYNHGNYLAAKIKTDNKSFWSDARSKVKSKPNIGQLVLPDGSYTNDKQEKAEILNSFVASVLQWRDQKCCQNFAGPISNININRTKIAKAFDKLKASKYQGPHQINLKRIKECKDFLLKPLERIFKKSVENSQLPNIWKYGNMKAIFKS